MRSAERIRHQKHKRKTTLMLKKFAVVALAVLATLMIVGCPYPDKPYNAPSLDGLNLHGMPVSKDDLRVEETYIAEEGKSDWVVFLPTQTCSAPDPVHNDYTYKTPTLSHYDPTSKTITILVNRENIGYCYEIYNADASGKIKPIIINEQELPSNPISSYALCYADSDIEGVPYRWCASSDSGTVYGGTRIREIIYAVNILKDNYFPPYDVALTGFAAAYKASDTQYRFFTSIFRYFDSQGMGDVGFLSNQLRKGQDTFALPEGLVKISTIAAYEWTVYKGQIPYTENISNMAKRMDGIKPVFETEE